MKVIGTPKRQLHWLKEKVPSGVIAAHYMRAGEVKTATMGG